MVQWVPQAASNNQSRISSVLIVMAKTAACLTPLAAISDAGKATHSELKRDFNYLPTEKDEK